MKMITAIIILICVSSLVMAVSSSSSLNFLSKSRADTLYCQINGQCTIQNLTVNNTLVINTSTLYINGTQVIGNLNMNGYDIVNVDTIQDDASKIMIDVTNNIIRDTVNDITSIDVGSSIIYDTSVLQSIDYDTRELWTAGGFATVDWEEYELFGDSAIQSMNWGDRILYANDGTTRQMFWGDPLIVNFYENNVTTGRIISNVTNAANILTIETYTAGKAGIAIAREDGAALGLSAGTVSGGRFVIEDTEQWSIQGAPTRQDILDGTGDPSWVVFRINGSTGGFTHGEDIDLSNAEYAIVDFGTKAFNIGFKLRGDNADRVRSVVDNQGTGDACTSLQLGGSSKWTECVDNSDGDSYKRAPSSNVNSPRFKETTTVSRYMGNTNVGTSWIDGTFSNVNNGYLAVTGNDANFEVVATDGGRVGATQSWKQVDGTTYENAWGLYRETNGDGTGDGRFCYTYGTNTNPATNDEKVCLYTNDTTEFDGDLQVNNNFTGNQIYGFMYVHNESADDTVIDAANTYVNITESVKAGLNNGFNFIQGNALEAIIPGVYKVTYSVSFSQATGAGDEWHIALGINGLEKDGCHAGRKIGTITDIGSATVNCIISVSVDDQITAMIENENDADDANINDMQLTLIRIGE